MASRKLSGAELAKQLEGLPFPGAVVSSQVEPDKLSQPPEADIETPSPLESRAPIPDEEVQARPSQGPRARSSGQSKPRGGRPIKAGVDGMPVNVRLSQADHLALARLAGKLVVPGRPMPTVQDVVRGIIRGALREPELATRLCRQQDA
jgi:hypothetical protein